MGPPGHLTAGGTLCRIREVSGRDQSGLHCSIRLRQDSRDWVSFDGWTRTKPQGTRPVTAAARQRGCTKGAGRTTPKKQWCVPNSTCRSKAKQSTPARGIGKPCCKLAIASRKHQKEGSPSVRCSVACSAIMLSHFASLQAARLRAKGGIKS